MELRLAAHLSYIDKKLVFTHLDPESKAKLDPYTARDPYKVSVRRLEDFTTYVGLDYTIWVRPVKKTFTGAAGKVTYYELILNDIQRV